MRLITTFLVAATLLGAGARASALTLPKPRLAVETNPVIVLGRNFRAGERVRVTLTVLETHVHTVTASAAGAFSVRFRGVTIGGCSSYIATAVGNRGSRASFKRMVECPPPAP